MLNKITQARVFVSTLSEYRKWAKSTGRNVSDTMEFALRFALTRKSEVEKEIISRLGAK